MAIIMLHRDLQHIRWICYEDEDDENVFISILQNVKTKEIIDEKIPRENVDAVIADLKRSGFVKGYIPEIRIS